jgi:hypothetical protein
MTRFRWLPFLALAGVIGAMACGGGGPTAPEIMNRDPGAPPPGSTITPPPSPAPEPCRNASWKHPCPDQ